MKKAYTFRIYPNKNQEVKLIKTLDVCRHLYNEALAERKRQAELNNLCSIFDVFPWGKPEWIGYYEQSKTLTLSKTKEQKEVYAQVLQNVLRRLDKSFKNFFRGFGYPRFKSRNRYNSFTYPQSGFMLENGKVTLSKIGGIRIFQHREIEGKIKTCTIKKDVNQWYVVFTVEIEKIIQPVEIQNTVGVDVGLNSLFTFSNGEKIEPPKYLRQSEKKLIRVQKELSRKKKGSANKKKQRIKIARVHRKIRNQRKDFAHKISRILVNKYDLIAFENLNIKGMLKNHHLAKSISDAGWNQLIQFTTYKAEEAGKIVELVNPNGTSQKCSKCGKTVPKDLSKRVHSCPFCGLMLDRDHNAAINILRKAVPTDCGELTPVESGQKTLEEAGSSVL